MVNNENHRSMNGPPSAPVLPRVNFAVGRTTSAATNLNLNKDASANV